MGHQNTKRHKASHGGYKGRPTKSEVRANFNFWAELKNKETLPEDEADELDVLFGETAEKLKKVGIQLRLF